MFVVYLLLALLAVFAVWLVKVYNRLQNSMQNIREMFSNLQAGLKKRQQLSSQIIEIASGYVAHEQLMQLNIAKGFAGIQMLAQSFPQLRADATYQKLMGQLESLENDILDRRERYNSRVNAYNSFRNSFPAVLVAKKLSFGIIQYFDADDEKFDLQAQGFARDDTSGLQEFLDGSRKAVGDAAAQAVRQINQGVAQLKDKIDGRSAAHETEAPKTERLAEEDKFDRQPDNNNATAGTPGKGENPPC